MISNAVLLFVIGYFYLVALALYCFHHSNPLSSSDGEIEERGDNYMRKREGKKGRRKRRNLLFEVNISRIVHRHCT